MYHTSISLCASLSKLSMTLNKRPDLTQKLKAVGAGAGGEEEQKSIVEHTTEIIQEIFTACLSDRSSPRNARPEGKKVGVYIFANVTLKLLFAVRTTYNPVWSRGSLSLSIILHKADTILSCSCSVEKRRLRLRSSPRSPRTHHHYRSTQPRNASHTSTI